jgi:uncharacterized membrane protein
MLAAAVIGVGAMAAADEIVFHQILGWHHFYDPAAADVALLSDGLLHAFELLALAGGFFWYAELRRRGTLHPTAAWSGLLLGAGGFQLFDGLVNHKLLGLHQIRYGVELWPYDLAWNLSAAALILAGTVLALRARRPRR